MPRKKKKKKESTVVSEPTQASTPKEEMPTPSNSTVDAVQRAPKPPLKVEQVSVEPPAAKEEKQPDSPPQAEQVSVEPPAAKEEKQPDSPPQAEQVSVEPPAAKEEKQPDSSPQAEQVIVKPSATKRKKQPNSPPQQDAPIPEGTEILVKAPWGKEVLAVVSGCYSSPEGQWWVAYKPKEPPIEGWTWEKGVIVLERVIPNSVE